MRCLVHIAFALISVMVVTGCKDDSTTVVSHATNPEQVPTMSTTDVSTVISDSGHTRYRIVSPVWNMFEEAKHPHWTFPKGVTCEELDNNYNTTTTIKCDSAYFDKDKALWSLTDAFIHIEKQGRIIEGYGYESNERLTTYTLRQVEAIFPIDERRMPHPGSGNTPRTMQ